MNPDVQQLYAEYLSLTGDRQQAAMLTLADALLTAHTAPPETVFVEPDGCHSYNIRETALRLHLSSQQVYHLILAGVLRCFRSGTSVRVPLDEIEHYEDECREDGPAPSTDLVPT